MSSTQTHDDDGEREAPKARAPKPQAPVAPPVTATPLEHGLATGNLRRIAQPVAFGGPGESPTPGQELASVDAHGNATLHAPAEALHRWRQHAHHAGAPIQLTREDYLAALQAAASPDASGNYRPHAAALSPFGG